MSQYESSLFEINKLYNRYVLKIVRGQMEEHYLSQQHQDILQKIIHEKNQPSTNIDISPTTTTTTTANGASAAPLKELYEMVYTLAGGVEALNGDGQRLNDEALQSQVQLQTLTENIKKIQFSVEESHGFLQGVKHNQEIGHQEVTSLKEEINDMQYVSYDGTYVWKIRNFREKMSK